MNVENRRIESNPDEQEFNPNLGSKDYYERLGVSPDASDDDIGRAYRRLVLKYHPDRNPGDADADRKYKAATEAFEVLNNAEKRNQYNFDRLRPNNAGAGPEHPENAETSVDKFARFVRAAGAVARATKGFAAERVRSMSRSAREAFRTSAEDAGDTRTEETEETEEISGTRSEIGGARRRRTERENTDSSGLSGFVKNYWFIGLCAAGVALYTARNFSGGGTESASPAKVPDTAASEKKPEAGHSPIAQRPATPEINSVEAERLRQREQEIRDEKLMQEIRRKIENEDKIRARQAEENENQQIQKPEGADYEKWKELEKEILNDFTAIIPTCKPYSEGNGFFIVDLGRDKGCFEVPPKFFGPEGTLGKIRIKLAGDIENLKSEYSGLTGKPGEVKAKKADIMKRYAVVKREAMADMVSVLEQCDEVPREKVKQAVEDAREKREKIDAQNNPKARNNPAPKNKTSRTKGKRVI